ncbi:MAG: nitroreductase family protein [Crenarchaeota archaeon]|nr:nitroreductase family protein [Thermoproteota archaeon]
MTCSPDELIEFLRSRRSIRRFKKEKVPMDLIKKILDVARYAPSAHNSQPWRFIVIDDRELLDKLSKMHGGGRPLRNAPQAIVVACDERASPDSYLLDCANATIYVQLAAHALGLGTVWIQTMRNIDDIRKLLDMPDHIVPASILAIGYPDEKPEPRPRIPLDEILCVNKYCLEG